MNRQNQLKVGIIAFVLVVSLVIFNFAIASEVVILDEDTIKATLSNGETGSFKIEKPGAKPKAYTIQANINANSDGVTFVVTTLGVNKLPTKLLGLGGDYTYPDVYTIIVSSISKDKVVFGLTGLFPDLTVSSIEFDSTLISAGKSVVIRWTVKNEGNLGAPSYITAIKFGDGGSQSLAGSALGVDGTASHSLAHTYSSAQASQDFKVEVTVSHSGNPNAENNKGEGTARVFLEPKRTQKFYANHMELVKGWNLISVTLPMSGKSIKEMSDVASISAGDRCLSERIGSSGPVAWMYFNNEWLPTKPSTPDSIFEATYKVDKLLPDHVGLGLWVFVSNENGCRLGCGLEGCLT